MKTSKRKHNTLHRPRDIAAINESTKDPNRPELFSIYWSNRLKTCDKKTNIQKHWRDTLFPWRRRFTLGNKSATSRRVFGRPKNRRDPPAVHCGVWTRKHGRRYELRQAVMRLHAVAQAAIDCGVISLSVSTQPCRASEDEKPRRASVKIDRVASAPLRRREGELSISRSFGPLTAGDGLAAITRREPIAKDDGTNERNNANLCARDTRARRRSDEPITCCRSILIKRSQTAVDNEANKRGRTKGAPIGGINRQSGSNDSSNAPSNAAYRRTPTRKHTFRSFTVRSTYYVWQTRVILITIKIDIFWSIFPRLSVSVESVVYNVSLCDSLFSQQIRTSLHNGNIHTLANKVSINFISQYCKA